MLFFKTRKRSKLVTVASLGKHLPPSSSVKRNVKNFTFNVAKSIEGVTKMIRLIKRTNIVERARMIRRNCSAGPVCLSWPPPTKYVKPL